MSGEKSKAKMLVGLGELLWDLLPEGPRLGGAPANFAVMAGRLGDHAVIASRLGADDSGADARALLADFPVDTSLLQTDPRLPTGMVTIALEAGEPHYTIHEPVAWDRLECTPEWEQLAKRADAVCFGTLAQRDERSRRAILGFLDATRPDCARIFDVNLRPPFWSGEVLRAALGRATILKLNAGELPQVLRDTAACPYPATAQDQREMLRGARQLMERYPMQMVCVTLGAAGSLLVTRSGFHLHPGLPVQVRDAVGAGDAFTAALTHYFLQGAPLATLNEAGNQWGAWMASQSGAMPPLGSETVKRIAQEIEARELAVRGHEAIDS
jgi:fructokinase